MGVSLSPQKNVTRQILLYPYTCNLNIRKMTLASILDSLKQNLNFRNELRETLEKLYPGMFNFTNKYYIRVENWDAKSMQVFKIFECLLGVSSMGRYIESNNFDYIPFGLLIGGEKLCIVDKKENYTYELEKEYIEDIKNVSKVIDIEDMISEITLFTEHFYYIDRELMISGNYLSDSLDLMKSDLKYRIYLRHQLEKIYPGIIDLKVGNYYFIPEDKDNCILILGIRKFLDELYKVSEILYSENRGLYLNGLSCYPTLWKDKKYQTEEEKEINRKINSKDCKIIDPIKFLNSIIEITKKYKIWK